MKTDDLRVLLVDDEYLIRELLKKCVKWEKLGCQIVGEASCAEEVFDFLEENIVDLIITDINMPVTDGLEMSKKILESYSKIKIIIISGYDKFEYAKNGIEIGIENYILKPIRETEVESAVLQVKEKLEKQRQLDYENSMIRQQLEQHIPYLKEKFFMELFRSKYSFAQIVDKLDFLKLELKDHFFQVALIEIGFNAEKRHSEEERLIELIGTVRLLESCMKIIPFIHVLVDAKENIGIFCNNADINLIEECNYVLESLKMHHPKWDITIGIGSIKENIEDVKDSYNEATTALQFKAVLGENQVIYYNDLEIVTHKTRQIPVLQENAMEQLQFLIKAGLYEQLIEYIDTLYENIGQYGNIEEQNFTIHIRIQTTRIISVLFYMITSMAIQIEDIAYYQEDFFKEVASITNIPQAKRLVVSLAEKLMKNINAIQTHMVNDSMEEISKYIQENMSDYGLTLNKIAVHFYMNPSYLSRIFKQKKGIAFKDYLNKIRMEAALEYVRSTDLKAYEIGEKVGVPDPNYFSTSFKKYIGMSMTDYKKLIFHEG
ncbi:response regulator [Cellulosilyticum sp. I15G10I2]|uniref:response regulator n=1 Tax=Cellulosilyticum sp. I15G10I2 TaxID=1892843 RepID=UPI00085C6C98|nr:response regulator [Cellulosilyticum sp. I15G10I2]